MNDALETAIAQLRVREYAVVENFLAPSAIAALYKDLCLRFNRGDARPAGIGRGAGFRLAPEVRGDRICWFDSHALSPSQTIYWAAMERLRCALNAAFFLGLDRFEAHYAHFPVGAHYARHRDIFNDHPQRSISASLYLNAQWSVADGGTLRLYPENAPAQDVLPIAGTLALFNSRALWHEVLPAQRDRYSVTAWFSVRALMA